MRWRCERAAVVADLLADAIRVPAADLKAGVVVTWLEEWPLSPPRRLAGLVRQVGSGSFDGQARVLLPWENLHEYSAGRQLRIAELEAVVKSADVMED